MTGTGGDDCGGKGLLGPDGPYASPHAAHREELAWRQFMWTSFVVIIVASLIGAMVGVLSGLGLATFVPQYYEAVFGSGYEAWQLGLGLGFVQGGGGGIGVGLAIVFASAWFRSRAVRNFPGE